MSPGPRILCLLKQTTKIPLCFSLLLASNIFTWELNIAWPWNEIESVADERYRMHSAQSSLYLQARHVSRSPYTMWKFMIGWQASSRPCNPLTPLPATRVLLSLFLPIVHKEFRAATLSSITRRIRNTMKQGVDINQGVPRSRFPIDINA